MPRLEMKKALRDKLVRGKNYIPNQREFVTELIDLAGGPRQLAKLIFRELEAKTTSPSVRARIMEIILRALKAIETAEPPQDPTTLSDDELSAFLDDRIDKYLEAAGGGTIAEEAGAG
ncbi:MAG TPA: hypothetical protein VFG68_12830 [Fimbriiglobus sp.]|nr:hypothetical protein [Fimbriiglobus sp.]